MSRTLHCVAITLMLTTLAFAENEQGPPAAVGPIERIDGVPANNDVFKPRGWSDPHVITSAEEAVKLLGEAGAKKLGERVNWEKQKVLVFAWRGSGQDRLSYEVAESYPEQVFFKFQPGRTRDLRPHVFVYALRNNVTWKSPGVR